jgi:hypothetical protein
MKKMISWKTFTAAFVAVLALCLACPAAFAVNGITNISAYSDGLVGYRTPNIDRIANEGMRFTDYYAEQSCTAGRSAFITGQSPVRTGLTKVGMPGADIGLRPISGSGPRTRRSPNCSSRTAT